MPFHGMIALTVFRISDVYQRANLAMNDFFQQTAQTEFQKASQQLPAAKQFQTALTHSFARYDRLIASTIQTSSTKPACQAGCAFCCYYKVEV
ncbi:MAG TPA: hypothetical protein VF433_15595, partial [Cellvibrio sp.]